MITANLGIFVLVGYLTSHSHVSKSTEMVHVPNSCRDLEDGVYTLKLQEDAQNTYPLVTVECSNEYMIIDVSKDANWLSYFSSHEYWHYGIIGPTNTDHVNWNDWFTPSKNDEGDYKFLFSKECSSCYESDISGVFQDSDDVPYMSGNLFGCFWPVRGEHDSDMDWDTYECYYQACQDTDSSCEQLAASTLTQVDLENYDHVITGACATLPLEKKFAVAYYHDECSNNQQKNYYKPSLGADGRNCVCAKPSLKGTTTYSIDEGEYTASLREYEDAQGAIAEAAGNSEENGNKEARESIHYLYQSDFEEGTYRIQESGIYVFMEDIVFDFNSGDLNEDGSWLPHCDQSEQYVGACAYRDPYFMGFFAGVTIECDNVVLDLNGKKLSQSVEFYYQQRWFSIIELASQPFMPAQGPGMFGADPKIASNVEIKNGYLGLTSHHGIHGNQNTNIHVHDIDISEFETHGIQLNGFSNIVLENIKIHDSSQIAYLKGEYGHGRMLLPRLKSLLESQEYEEYLSSMGEDEDNPDIDLEQIYEDLMDQLNLAFSYVMRAEKNVDFGKTLVDLNNRNEYESWQKAKETFLYLVDEDSNDVTSDDASTTNSFGLPYGTGLYGIFLSLPGANVFSIGNSVLRSNGAVLKHIEIYGLRHRMHEYVRFQNGITFNVNPFNAVMDARAMLSDLTDIDSSTYVGNIMSDAYAALDYISNNWGLLQMANLNDGELTQWMVGVRDSISSDTYQIKCNADVMTHSGKGIMGIRLDGVSSFSLENIEIFNMYDYTELGSEICGDYDGSKLSNGHFLQKVPMQSGFSGNMVHGIHAVNSDGEFKNINVHNIGSGTGLASGISIYKGCDIELNGNIGVSNIVAGFNVDPDVFSYSDRPNQSPEACGITVYWSYDDDEASYDSPTVTTSNEDELKIEIGCVVGHVGCFDSDLYGGSTLGSYIACDDNVDKSIHVADAFRTEIDEKLIGTEKHTLNDFTSRDSILFDKSKELFGMINEDNTANNKMHRQQDELPSQETRNNKIELPVSHEKRWSEKKLNENKERKITAKNESLFSDPVNKLYLIAGAVVAIVVTMYALYYYFSRKARKDIESMARINVTHYGTC